MRNTANNELRTELYSKRIPYWKLAIAVGVHESTIIRWFRTELTVDQKEKVRKAITKIETEGIKC